MNDYNKQESRDALSELVACLSLLRMQYQLAHWQATGSSAYGDHLLFQRLYESIVSEIDELAEKAVGVFEATLTLSDQLNIMQQALKGMPAHSSHLEACYLQETRLMAMVEEVYNFLDEAECLSLGLDDFLAALASSHETNLYLLQQRMKG
jgi:DNA-binding ferritin-like protein